MHWSVKTNFIHWEQESSFEFLIAYLTASMETHNSIMANLIEHLIGQLMMNDLQ